MKDLSGNDGSFIIFTISGELFTTYNAGGVYLVDFKNALPNGKYKKNRIVRKNIL
jgi:hypothetical protein